MLFTHSTLHADENFSPEGKPHQTMGHMLHVSGYDRGRKEAKFSGRPMLLVFADREHGVELRKAVFSDPKSLEKLEPLLGVLLTPRSRKQVSLYQLKKFPALVITDAKGRVHGKLEGVVDRSKILEFVKNCRRSMGKIQLTSKFKEIHKEWVSLKKASKRGKISEALDAIARLKAMDHAGPELRFAKDQQKVIEEFGESQLKLAKLTLKSDARAGIKMLRKIARDFEGTSLGNKALRLAERKR